MSARCLTLFRPPATWSWKTPATDWMTIPSCRGFLQLSWQRGICVWPAESQGDHGGSGFRFRGGKPNTLFAWRAGQVSFSHQQVTSLTVNYRRTGFPSDWPWNMIKQADGLWLKRWRHWLIRFGVIPVAGRHQQLISTIIFSLILGLMNINSYYFTIPFCRENACPFIQKMEKHNPLYDPKKFHPCIKNDLK